MSLMSFEQQCEKLKKLKVPELIQEVRKRNLYIKGLTTLKKQNIIDLLTINYKKTYCAFLINRFIYKHFKPFLIKKCNQLRGDCFELKKKCINDTDFYTLEPLNNIPFNQFFCFQDEKGFYYGFNIFSFEHLIPYRGSKKKCLNPYTRDEVDESLVQNIAKLIRLTKITEINITDINKEPIETSDLTNEPIITLQIRNTRFMGNSIYPRNLNLNEQQKHIMEMMIEKRNKSLDSRIQDVFYEIDFLGNYTERVWFDEMSRGQYIRFFNQLHDYWRNDGHIQVSLKYDICFLTGDPFYNLLMKHSHNLSFDEIKEACLIVMENLTFTGKDDESRKMGVIYILINLSFVSENVRNAISWLN
jgi:hypothetical protein